MEPQVKVLLHTTLVEEAVLEKREILMALDMEVMDPHLLFLEFLPLMLVAAVVPLMALVFCPEARVVVGIVLAHLLLQLQGPLILVAAVVGVVRLEQQEL